MKNLSLVKCRRIAKKWKKTGTEWSAEITTAKREFKEYKYNKIPILQHTTREQLAYTVRDKTENGKINLRARASMSYSVAIFKTFLCKFLSLLNCYVYASGVGWSRGLWSYMNAYECLRRLISKSSILEDVWSIGVLYVLDFQIFLINHLSI